MAANRRLLPLKEMLFLQSLDILGWANCLLPNPRLICNACFYCSLVCKLGSLGQVIYFEKVYKFHIHLWKRIIIFILSVPCVQASVFTACMWEFGEDLACISQGKTFCTNTVTFDLLRPLRGRWGQYYHDYPTALRRKLRLREDVLSPQAEKTR